MLNFAYPQLLFLLILIPAIAVLYILARKARIRKLMRFGKLSNLKSLMPQVSDYKPAVKLTLLLIALFFVIVALARPWGGVVEQQSSKNGIEVAIAVDASNSMLASATSDPTDASRMTTAKVMMARLIENMTNDKVGLVVFAGEAYTLIPASSDYVSAKSFLNSISPEDMPSQGTNISAAISTAMTTFSKNAEGKAIVLLTDAEELEDENAAVDAVKKARAAGIQVNIIGVGSTDPVVIPYNGSSMIDENGETVRTSLNEALGQKLAQAGGGVYVNASTSDALDVLQRKLREVKHTTLSTSTYAVHNELFVIFALIAIVLLVAETFVSSSKNRLLSKVTFFKKGAMTVKTKKEN